MISCWSVLCVVDVAPLTEFLDRGDPGWPAVKGGQPNRIKAPLEALPVIQAVLASFAEPVRYETQYACLSRVHVPIVTNPNAWFMWEPEGTKVHFEAGKAYSFNTLVNHAFGNDGDTERVHLTFDVLDG